MDDAVQNIIADVGCGAFHALHVNLTLGHVEIVVQELPSVFCLPEKIFGDISPELWTQRDKQMRIQNLCTEKQSKITYNFTTYQWYK